MVVLFECSVDGLHRLGDRLDVVGGEVEAVEALSLDDLLDEAEPSVALDLRRQELITDGEGRKLDLGRVEGVQLLLEAADDRVGVVCSEIDGTHGHGEAGEEEDQGEELHDVFCV